MKELEIKILNVDTDVLCTSLLSHNAMYLGAIEFRSIFLENLNGVIVRVRSEGEKIVVNTKIGTKFKNGVKINDEYEMIIPGNLYEVVEFFEKMGLKKVRALKKKRTNYVLNKMKYSFDKNYFIPDSLEIEADSLSNAIKGAQLIGFTQSDFSTLSEDAIYETYNQDRGIIFQDKYQKNLDMKYLLNYIEDQEGIILKQESSQVIHEENESQSTIIYYSTHFGELGSIFEIAYRIYNLTDKKDNTEDWVLSVLRKIPGFLNWNKIFLCKGFIATYPRYIKGEISEEMFIDVWNETTLKLYFESNLTDLKYE